MLAEEYDKSNKVKLMGADFHFDSWAQSWLTTTGVNTIEPLVQYDESGMINYLSIKQSSEGRSWCNSEAVNGITSVLSSCHSSPAAPRVP